MAKSNDRIKELQRRLLLLDRIEGREVRLDDGLFLLSANPARDPRPLIAALEGGSMRSTDLASLPMIRPPIEVTGRLLAKAHRDLRALETNPELLELANEAKRAFQRYGSLDARWMEEKRGRLDRLSSQLRALEPAADWFGRALELIAVVHGDAAREEALRLAHAVRARIDRKRRSVRTTIELLAHHLEGDQAGSLPESVRAAAEELRRSRRGRVHVRRVVALLRRLLELPDEGSHLMRDPSLGALALPELVREVGRELLRAIPSSRSPVLRDRVQRTIAAYGLMFDPRPRYAEERLRLEPAELTRAEQALERCVANLGGRKLTMVEALGLLSLEPSTPIDRLALLVEEGLSIARVRRMVELGQLKRLLELAEKGADAEAYCTWIERLAPHYQKLGLDLAIPSNVFDNLRKKRGQDLAVLAVCLLERHSVERALALLDATLGLFRSLPEEVSGILRSLTSIPAKCGARTLPELAAWLKDDELLDRWVHLSNEAELPPVLSRRLRRDFDRVERLEKERHHLSVVHRPTPAQRARLEAIARQLAEAPDPGWTQRRMREQSEELLALAYRRHVDRAFRRLLEEVWSISLSELTPAWRDAIRFYLAVDKNRELLGTVLKLAARHPGEEISARLTDNASWLARAGAKLKVDRWLAPRSQEITAGGKRYRISTEHDPVEVLRMGIPFSTCLSLESGINAASTTINAADANKRVIYVRDARGTIVARKLVAISIDWNLVGFRVYSSLAEDALSDAVDAFALELAEEIGIDAADDGRPNQLHPGFWYDDGVEPFRGRAPRDDSEVARYCGALGVGVPKQIPRSLYAEAELARAESDRDATRAIAALRGLQWGHPVASLRWIVEALGENDAIRTARDHERLARAVLYHLADRPRAMLETAVLFEVHFLAEAAIDLLREMEPSEEIAAALIEAGVNSSKRNRDDDHGFWHQTLYFLPELMEHVPFSSWFELTDRAADLWSSIREFAPGCSDCVYRGEQRLVSAAPRRWRVEQDPEVILRCLTSKRRSPLSHRAALHIAERFQLGGNEVLAALDRFAALEPALDLTLARSRQSGSEPQPPEEKELLEIHRLAALDEIDRFAALDALTVEQERELETMLREHTTMFAPQLPARLALRLLRHDRIRDLVAEILGQHCYNLLFRRWVAIGRVAARTGISIEGLLEKSIETALRFARLGPEDADTHEEIERVIRVAVRMRDPAKLLALLEDLPVERSAAYLLDELQRQGALRDCTLALKKMAPWHRNPHRRRWLEERLLHHPSSS